jgi:hypothetical protein
LITPYSHGDPQYNAYLDPLINQCDLYLAITGNFWFRSIQNSVFSHWWPKMIHLDLAVDRNEFPALKKDFNPPGQRAFVYIGVYKPYKNLGYLSQIAGQLPETHIDWIGSGRSFPNLKPRGAYDFSTPEAKEMIRHYDFLITVGNSDPNPTTILETMSWGLIPVCTEQSGYTGFPGIINIKLDDLESALRVLRQLQKIPERQLLEIQRDNWKILDDHFNWDRFTNQVIDAIESDISPPVASISARRRWAIRRAEISSIYAVWRRPRHLGRVLFHFARQLLIG